MRKCLICHWQEQCKEDKCLQENGCTYFYPLPCCSHENDYENNLNEFMGEWDKYVSQFDSERSSL